ncbi:MAG: putative sulfate exporter family transporter [Rhodospirillaceae bacterium]|nr:putative sulfate exporter family transporter [Rhodospirillaceae bacterium]
MIKVFPKLIGALPGIALCVAVSLAAAGLEIGEKALFGRSWLEALVLAILLGTLVRTLWTPAPVFRPGIAISGKLLLEIAVVLLGASISYATVMEAGPALLFGIVGVVALAILFSFGVGRLLGLRPRLALLVACGNSICGNSAIAAVAPVIGADGDDIASSIAFTAVLGVAVVLTLPLLVGIAGLSNAEYGVLAGLTVYAVPQVLAATAPVSMLSVQVGTLVKLVRVLMLGPVVLILSLVGSSLRDEADALPVTANGQPGKTSVPIHRLVPWFIIGFLLLATLRSMGLIPEPLLAPMAQGATVLTVLSMAALGLGVDVRTVAQAGPRVTATVLLSLFALGAVSLALIHGMRG